MLVRVFPYISWPLQALFLLSTDRSVVLSAADTDGALCNPKYIACKGFRIPADLIFLLTPEADSPHADSNLSDRNCLICISLTSFCSAPQRYHTALAGEGKWQKSLQLAQKIVVAVPGIEPGFPD